MPSQMHHEPSIFIIDETTENILATSKYFEGMKLIAEALQNPFVYQNVSIGWHAERAINNFISVELPRISKAIGVANA